ncbi:MAG: hypothetical protein K8S13_00515 [Desulfobacula sp.]|uniref:hypothetical protein n=1 Tax=Desulfobacula sp. TaxID=2593537 RepID=UPI0025C219BA|nr:hypothetical protein [Desulfobacula sp.]MCD4718330.1 hypothetical protein [Desulfobacula sp.]
MIDLIWTIFPETSHAREASPMEIKGEAVPVGKRKNVKTKKLKIKLSGLMLDSCRFKFCMF